MVASWVITGVCPALLGGMGERGRIQMFRTALLLAAAALVLGGCASHRTYGSAEGITLIDAATLPTPDGGSGNYDSRIGRFDTLLIDVLGFEELNDVEVMVDGSGDITLPIAGKIHVSGLTTNEAVDSITRSMQAKYVRAPQVGVNFKEVSSNYVTVSGSVTMPGNYPVIEGMTLTRAIASARGLNDIARTREVVVMRAVDGQQYVALYDLRAIEMANYPDPAIFSRDTIVVGESAQRRLIQQVIQGAPLLVSPIVALLQQNN